MLDFTHLSTHYPISPVIEVKDIKKGNSSNAKLIITKDRKYILRNVENVEQAMTEFTISRILSKQNISPQILLTQNQQPYMKNKECIYNLQIYIENQQNEKKEINFYNLGKTLSIFHSKVLNSNGIYEKNDRFHLEKMWNDLRQIDDFNKFELKIEILTLVEQCLNYHHEVNSYIHGDLGIWNLLFTPNDIYIIDFGEVRRGNNHFDMSAAILSTLDWNRGENTIVTSLADFRDGYSSNFDLFSWEILKENIHLWTTRGIIALLCNHEINEQICDYVKATLDKSNILDQLISTHFLNRL